MALVALLIAASAHTMTIHAEVDGRLHVRVTFGAGQLLYQTLVVVRLKQRVEDNWKTRTVSSCTHI